MKKLTLKEIKELKLSCSKGEWKLEYEGCDDGVAIPEWVFYINNKELFRVPDGYGIMNLEDDCSLIENSPQIATQYIELAEALKKLNMIDVDIILEHFGILDVEDVE